MGHVYATLAEANDYLTSGGSTKFAAESAVIQSLKLGILESVSRIIDEKAERSGFGSGFGPRTGTNRYDGCAGNTLRLRDDLLTVTSITLRDSTASTGTQTAVADTDYYLVNDQGLYSPGPYRTLILHRHGISNFGYGYRVTDIAGVWGYSSATVTSSTTMASGFSASTTATTFTTSAAPTLSPGMTLLVGSEQMYLSGLASTTATVIRGVNGTTAAVHADSSAIAYYTYEARAHETCLRLFQRRWRARDAGADGSEEGLHIAGIPQRESEDTIARRGLYGLRLKEMV